MFELFKLGQESPPPSEETQAIETQEKPSKELFVNHFWDLCNLLEEVESTNKGLERIFTKTIQLHKKDWVDRLLEALWAYKTTWNNTIGFIPCEMVYGKQVLFLIEFYIKTFKIAVELGMDLSEAQKEKIVQLKNELDEMR